MIVRQSLLRHGRQSLRSARLQNFCTSHRLCAGETELLSQQLSRDFQESKAIAKSINTLSSSETIPAIQSPVQPKKVVQSIDPDEFLEYQRQSATTGQIGAQIAPHYEPNQLISNPPRPSDVTLELLLASQSHLGHKTSLWNPANSRYIFGVRDGIHIISLEETAAHLRRAAKVVSAVAERGGLILFAGTREGQDRCVVKAAELTGGCHLFERWIPGSITNSLQILGDCKLKVIDELDNEVDGFQEEVGKLAPLKPDLVVCLNPLENWVLLHECALHNIPTIGVIDTDADPTWVTYPIPANDDSLRCVQVIAGVLGRAGEEGKERRLARAADTSLPPSERITFEPAQNLQAGSDVDDSGSDTVRYLRAWKKMNTLTLAPSITALEHMQKYERSRPQYAAQESIMKQLEKEAKESIRKEQEEGGDGRKERRR